MDKALSQQVLAEHEMLMHVMNALRTILDWKDHDYDLSRKLSSLCFATQSFQRHLERLMSLEEHHGYMELVTRSRPELRAEIDKLHEEHLQLRSTLTEIVNRLEAIPPTGHESYAMASDELAAFLRDVEEHGNRETELLENALL